MPNVTRSRDSWRTSLRGHGAAGARERSAVSLLAGHACRASSRRRTRPRGWRAVRSTLRLDAVLLASSARNWSAGILRRCGPRARAAACRAASRRAPTAARGRSARRLAAVGALDFDRRRRRRRPSGRAACLRPPRGPRRGSPGRGSARPRPCSESRPGWSRRASASCEQALPEIAAALRIDRAGRLVEQQQLGRVQRGRGQREALLLAAAHGARALLAQIARGCRWRAAAAMRASHVAFEPVEVGDEFAGSRRWSGLPTARISAACSRAGARMASASFTTERPNTSACPSLGSSMPHSMRSVVDLPEPLGPRNP